MTPGAQPRFRRATGEPEFGPHAPVPLALSRQLPKGFGKTHEILQRQHLDGLGTGLVLLDRRSNHLDDTRVHQLHCVHFASSIGSKVLSLLSSIVTSPKYPSWAQARSEEHTSELQSR